MSANRPKRDSVRPVRLVEEVGKAGKEKVRETKPKVVSGNKLDGFDFKEGTVTVDYLQKCDRDSVKKKIQQAREIAKKTLIVKLRVTKETFEDSQELIQDLEYMNVHAAGICGIYPPKDFIANKNNPDSKEDFYMKTLLESYRVIQNDLGREDNVPGVIFLKEKSCSTGRPKPAQKFYAKGTKIIPEVPKNADLRSACEEIFHLLNEKYIRAYATDKEDTLMDSSGYPQWNLNTFRSVLDEIKTDSHGTPGVHTALLYFSVYLSLFPIHVEDFFYYSLNYLHFGSNKAWFGVPLDDAPKMETLLHKLLKSEYRNCKSFLQHKDIFLHPQLLHDNGIQMNILVQEPNMFVLTFPRGYHMGFSLGNCVGEAVNFGGPLLPERLLVHNACICGRMDHSKLLTINHLPFLRKNYFLKKYGTENGENEYNNYLLGKYLAQDPDGAKSVGKKQVSCGPFGSFQGAIKFLKDKSSKKHSPLIHQHVILAVQSVFHFTDNNKDICKKFISADVNGVELFYKLLEEFKVNLDLLEYILSALLNVLSELEEPEINGIEILGQLLEKLVVWLQESPFALEQQFPVNLLLVLILHTVTKEQQIKDFGSLIGKHNFQLDIFLISQIERLNVLDEKIHLSFKLDELMYKWVCEDNLVTRMLSMFVISNNVASDYIFWNRSLSDKVREAIESHVGNPKNTWLKEYAKRAEEAIKLHRLNSRAEPRIDGNQSSTESLESIDGSDNHLNATASAQFNDNDAIFMTYPTNEMESGAPEDIVDDESQVGSYSSDVPILSLDELRSAGVPPQSMENCLETHSSQQLPNSGENSAETTTPQQSKEVLSPVEDPTLPGSNTSQAAPARRFIGKTQDRKRHLERMLTVPRPPRRPRTSKTATRSSGQPGEITKLPSGRFMCNECPPQVTTYATYQKLQDHLTRVHAIPGGMVHKCDLCGHVSQRPDNMKKHRNNRNCKKLQLKNTAAGLEVNVDNKEPDERMDVDGETPPSDNINPEDERMDEGIQRLENADGTSGENP